MLAQLSLGSPQMAIWACLLGGAGFALVFWGYRRGVGGRFRGWCMAMKLLALALLAFSLLDPQWTSERPKSGANIMVVLADNSRSMDRKSAEGEAVGEGLRELLVDEGVGSISDSPWLTELGENFLIRRYQFGNRVRRVRDFSGLDFHGEASALGGALEKLGDDYADRPLAGVVVFSDAQPTDPDVLDSAGGLPPLYFVVPPEDSAPTPDVAISEITLTQSAFEDAPVTMTAAVQAEGFDGQELVARLFDSEGAELESQSWTVPEGEPGHTLRFRTRPPGGGSHVYRLELEPADPAARAESTGENNRATIAVNRGRGPYRILYVSGRPNWEYKFLARSVASDPELQLVSLIRIAKREPKFEWRGRSGEKGNPLFRGFAGDEEDEDSYDKPILTRLGVRDAAELAGGFPKVAEDLFDDYQAIILDDVEAEFFTFDQQLLIQEFVARRGGGFLMLGGRESFHGGDYTKSPIADLLPFFLEGDGIPEATENHRIALSREGWLEPWVRLHESESREKARFAAMPGFMVAQPTGPLKPGASVILTAAPPDRSPESALVSQRFGRGRSAALAIGDMWRWGMKGPEEGEALGKAWRQTLRWLVADVPRRVSLTIPDPNISGETEFRVEVLDPDYLPTADAEVSVELIPPPQSEAKPMTLHAEADPDRPGSFRATTTLPSLGAGGAWHAKAAATSGDGEEIGIAESGFALNPALDEFPNRPPDRDLLERLAERTGGRLIPANPEALRKFSRGLESLEAPVVETTRLRIWHHPTVLLLILALLAGEWILRRKAGLP